MPETTGYEYAEHASLPAWVPYDPAKAGSTGDGPDPLGARWSAPGEPPAIGADIVVTINSCGLAYVTGYFTQGGWLGVLCTLRDPPEWHVKQNKGNPKGHAFGAEQRPAVAADLADRTPVVAESGPARAVRLGYTVEGEPDETDGVQIWRYVRPNGEADSEWLADLTTVWEGAGSDSFLWELDHS